MSTPELPDSAPARRACLGLATTVLFPRDVCTVELAEPENLRALARLNALDALCVAVPLRDPDPASALTPERFLGVGTLARAVDRTALPSGGLRVVLQGIRRACLTSIESEDGAFWAHCEGPPPPRAEGEPGRTDRALESLRADIEALARVDEAVSRELSGMIGLYGRDLERITDLVAAVLPLGYKERAALLAELDAGARLETLIGKLETSLVRARAGHELE